MNFHGEVLQSDNVAASVPSYTSKMVMDTKLDKRLMGDDRIVVAAIEKEGTVIDEEAVALQEPKHLKLPKPNLKVEASKLSTKRFSISIESDVYVKALWLDVKESNAWFSDNFLDLTPNKPKSLDVTTDKELTLQEFRDRLTLIAYPYR
jgi:beta-mannosidase